MITELAGVALYALHGKVDVAYAALVGIPAMGGAVFGAAAQRRISSRFLTIAFSVLLAAVGIWLLAG